METHHPVTRAVRAVTSATSRVFRCCGLHSVPAGSDSLGLHDLLYWIVFIALGGAWFLFLFAPQRQRLGLLDDRLEVLGSHLREDKRELQRLRRGIRELQQGDPLAWERTARARLGWLEPGETVDVRALAGEIQAPRTPVSPPAPPPPGHRPAPLVPANVFAMSHAADTSALGPLYGSPPLPPHLPLPSLPRSWAALAQNFPSRSLPVAYPGTSVAGLDSRDGRLNTVIARNARPQ